MAEPTAPASTTPTPADTPTASPAPEAAPASTPTPPAPSAVKPVSPVASFKGKDCSNCLSGGSPHKKSVTSGLLLLSIGIATVLGALLIQQLRTTYTTRQELAEAKSKTITTSDPAPMEQDMAAPEPAPKPRILAEFVLPDPEIAGTMSVEQALANRRSQREFQASSLTQAELSQLLWAAQGVTDEDGHRTAPSARGLYPFEMYVVVNEVDGLEPGLYVYVPETNSLGLVKAEDMRPAIEEGGAQATALPAPVILLMAGSFGDMVESFPDNYEAVTYLEGGHIGQNLYLQAEALGLGMVTQAGFDPVAIGQAVGLHELERVIYMIPVGVPVAKE